MPKMEELWQQISAKLAKEQNEPFFVSKTTWVRIWSIETNQRNNRTVHFWSNRRKYGGIIQIEKRVLRSIRHSSKVPRKNDRKLNHQAPICLDDIKVVRKGNKERHRTKLLTRLKELEEASHSANEKKIRILSQGNFAETWKWQTGKKTKRKD